MNLDVYFSSFYLLFSLEPDLLRISDFVLAVADGGRFDFDFAVVVDDETVVVEIDIALLDVLVETDLADVVVVDCNLVVVAVDIVPAAVVVDDGGLLVGIFVPAPRTVLCLGLPLLAMVEIVQLGTLVCCVTSRV